MNITCFNDLLQTARQQEQPQRLLLVFASAELPDDCSAQQRADFHAGRGGALVPQMCVDKSPTDLMDFDHLKQEAAQFSGGWQVVLASSLSGIGSAEPTQAVIDVALERMVASTRAGQLNNIIAFDTQGQALVLN